MSPKKLPDDVYAALLAEADLFTRERVLRNGTFFCNELSAHLAQRFGEEGQEGIGPTVLGRLLEDLRAEHFGTKEGYSRHGVSRIRPATLADLVTVARESVESDYSAPKGRRASREVFAITPAQLLNVLTAAAEVAEMVTGDRANLAAVGPEHFRWIPTAGELGQGEWALVERIEAHSDESAMRAHGARRKAGDPVWHRDLNASRRKAHAAGVRILLDLAATKGRLARGDAIEACERASRRAAEWNPHCKAWTARLVADIGKSVRKVEQGIKTLALYATRQGALAPEDTDWEAIRDAVERDFRLEEHPISNDVRTWAAYSYRALRERGLIDGPDWPKALKERMSLVQTGLAKRSVSSGDFSAWVNDGGPRPEALCAILEEWHDWATLPDDLLEEEHRAGRLPLRTWSNPTPEQRVRAAADWSLFRLDTATLEGRINCVNLAAGFAARHRGADFDTDPDCDLALVDPDTLQAHIRHRHPGKADAKDALMANNGWQLATLASPFLESRALLHRDHALAAGDVERAEQLRAKADLLRAHAMRLQTIAARATPAKRMRDSDGEELTRKEIQRIWQLWTADGVSGWRKLGLMRDAMVRDIERLGVRCDPAAKRAGVVSLSIGDQIKAIKDGRFQPTITWATLVRDAVIITLLWKIPLRLRNVVGMTFTNLQRLEGGVMQLAYTAGETKADRSFEPPILTADELTDPHAIAMVRPDLWELYLMAGGGREEVLRLTSAPGVVVREWTTVTDVRINGRKQRQTETRWRFLTADCEPAPGSTDRDRELGPGDVCPSRHVFPATARRGGGHGVSQADRVRAEMAYNGDAFAQQFSKRMREYAVVMNIDADALGEYFGAFAPHIVRLLFGSHHCDPDRWADAIGADAASILLHHAGTDITRRKYAARNERATSAVSRHAADLEATGAVPMAGTMASGYADELRRAADRLEAGIYTMSEFRALKEAINARFGVSSAA